ncbi:peptide ABC transporter substrate-binding protein [Vagococcus fessus]|uniref:Peptide ABC transporter substrate-binding protein n=1 Tax=Vagococcus fessus TaxID=120370 RepID=A0A430ADJ4_9ENTE|nr:peptide ABC transporter substrate-binding protein [Vagococcus fessus]RSU05280.1 peptide ABC transporter substrate-binding protein [Vagococcus fessus]
MKKFMSIGLVSVAVLTLAACGKGEESSKGKAKDKGKTEQVLNLSSLTEIPSADISLNTDAEGSKMINTIYEGIYRVDKDGVPQPAGAKELAKVSDDGKVYTIKLREDAKWSDGEPVKAADYVYSWQRTVDPKTASQYAYMFEGITNAKEISKGKKPVSELGIKAKGDYELEITLDQPIAYFDRLLAFPNFFPQRQDIVEKYGKGYATASEKSVYNGPFVSVEFDGPGSDTEWAYEKNPEYWDKDTVKLNRINVTVIKEASTAVGLYKNGQLDQVTLSSELAQQLGNDPDYQIDETANTAYIEMNQAKEGSPFKNENFRKALYYGIDRQSYVDNLLAKGNVVSSGIVPKGMVKNPKTGKDFTEDANTMVKFDKEKAQEYLAKAKKELGKEEISFDLLAGDSDGAKKNSEFIQSQIQTNLPGVKVTVSPVTFAVRLERTNKGDFDAVMGGWNADYADASNFLELFKSDNAYNRGKYNNPKYDKAVEEATKNGTNPEKRWENQLEAERILMSDFGVLPLNQNVTSVLRSPKIKNLVTNSAGAKIDYKWISMED